LRRQLENQVKELGLEADVTLAGNRTDPQNFYPALDIVALTSKNEGTPLTLIEAMANERAVIATAVGGVVDLLGEPFPERERVAMSSASEVSAFPLQTRSRLPPVSLAWCPTAVCALNLGERG